MNASAEDTLSEISENELYLYGPGTVTLATTCRTFQLYLPTREVPSAMGAPLACMTCDRRGQRTRRAETALEDGVELGMV